MLPELTSSQVLFLRALLEHPEGMTRAELHKATKTTPTGHNLGPVYGDSIPRNSKYKDSLYARRYVTATKFADDEPVIYKITGIGREAAKKFSARKRLTNTSNIPAEVLDPIIRQFKTTRTYGLELYTDADIAEIRNLLDEDYAGISLDDLRQRIVNRRKQGAFATITELPVWYKDYIKTPAFRKVREKALKFYGGCSIDIDHQEQLEVYHRAFVDRDGASVLNRESPEDLIVLCGRCYKRNHRYLAKVPETDVVGDADDVDLLEEED